MVSIVLLTLLHRCVVEPNRTTATNVFMNGLVTTEAPVSHNRLCIPQVDKIPCKVVEMCFHTILMVDAKFALLGFFFVRF